MSARRGSARRGRFVSAARLVLVGVALTSVSTACTGVPVSSTPQVVETLDAGAGPHARADAQVPPAFANPQAIVSGFLEANASNDAHHAAARLYLTQEEKNKWSDSIGTTILATLRIKPSASAPRPNTATFTVSGDPVGTLNPSGQFTPNLQGNAPAQAQTITLTKVKGQWRISNLPYNGLLISEQRFEQIYQPEFVYFFDQAGQRMVPYLRYTPLTDSQALAGWLMTQLASPPSGSAVSTDLPSIPDASQLTVTVAEGLITVALPGASKLDAATKYRMAAQVAYTLDPAAPGAPMRITDGGTPVVIPKLGSATFYRSDFARYAAPTIKNPQLYFVYQGGVVDATGKTLPGDAGSGARGVSSVALARTSRSAKVIRVAATSGTGSKMQLLLGQTDESLRETTVTGTLSRPDWVPGRDEVWIGDGKRLYRVTGSGKAHVVPISLSSGTVSGTITAVRLSPDGSRVALVIAVNGGAAQIWIGLVGRTSSAVQVSGLTAISPATKVIEDVAWDGPRDLYAVGYDLKEHNEPSVYTVRCDGSLWTPPSREGIGNLPQPGPSSIAVLPNAPAVVSAGNPETVWVQTGADVTGSSATWASPGDNLLTYGSNPVYVK